MMKHRIRESCDDFWRRARLRRFDRLEVTTRTPQTALAVAASLWEARVARRGVAELASADLVRGLKTHGHRTKAEPDSFSARPATLGYAGLLRRHQRARAESEQACIGICRF